MTLQHQLHRSKLRSLGIAALASIAVLVALPEAGHTDQGEGTVRMLPEIAPSGFLIEGRYADDPIIRLVKSEPLMKVPAAHQMPAF